MLPTEIQAWTKLHILKGPSQPKPGAQSQQEEAAAPTSSTFSKRLQQENMFHLRSNSNLPLHTAAAEQTFTVFSFKGYFHDSVTNMGQAMAQQSFH